jgi:hypothetical protein
MLEMYAVRRKVFYWNVDRCTEHFS